MKGEKSACALRSPTKGGWRACVLGTSLIVLVTSLALGAGGRPSSYNQMSSARRQGMQTEVQRLFALLQNYHYHSQPLVGMDSHVMIDAYLRQLDPMGVYFLTSDETFIHRRFGRSLKSSYLLSGDLYPAYEIFDLFRERFEARQTWVRERLGRPFDLVRADTFSWDRRESKLCKDAAEADALWERYLAAALISERLLNDDPEWAVGQVLRSLDERARRLAAMGPEDIEEQFLNALLLLQDPHSGYDSWDTLLDRDVEMSGTLVGIGADLKVVDGEVVVDRVRPGSAADLSGGLHRGDRIVSVAEGDGELAPLAGLQLQDIVTRIRGEAGTKLTLEVLRAGEAERARLVLERARIELGERRASAALYVVPVDSTEAGEVRVGVIDLPSFYADGKPEEASKSSSGADVGELLGKLTEAGAQAVVLDLRGNPGGYNLEAVRVTGQFIDAGTVFVTRRSDGVIESLVDKKAGMAWSGPLVVLTSASSASAAEVASGTLQAYGRAIVVGADHTFGKGTSQAVIPLGADVGGVAEAIRAKWGSLRLTAMRFYLPDGNGTQVKGVPSDIVLPTFRPPYASLEESLPGALPWDRIELPDFADARGAVVLGTSVVSEDLREHLRSRSASRVGALPELLLLNRRIEMLREAYADKEVVLDLEKLRAVRDARRAVRRSLVEEERKLQAEITYPRTRLLLASVEAQETAHRKQGEGTTDDGVDPRVGRLIDGVYYHQKTPGDAVNEMELASLDFDAYVDDADLLASAFCDASGSSLSADQLVSVLADQAVAASGDDGTLLDRLASVARTEADLESLRRGVEAILAKIVEIDPSVAGDAGRFDVTLREALRIAADWHCFEQAGSVSRESRDAPVP